MLQLKLLTLEFVIPALSCHQDMQHGMEVVDVQDVQKLEGVDAWHVET